MTLRITDPELEKLASDVARLAGETTTEAIRRALAERKSRLRAARIKEYLKREVWPNIPPEFLGRAITKDEIEEVLGYGPEGV
jgi:antitoxin VapB